MAKKMYYSEEEAAERLGVSAEELNTYVRDDKLRVFQDGTRKMFKVDEVDALAGGGEGEPEPEGEEIELTPADTTEEASLSDADEVTEPSGKEDTVITAEGISIFDDEDLDIEAADPMAKTQIAPSLEEQASMESTGSGSGLLDLTRESDDTSLGAEVLDQIDMEEVGSDIMAGAEADVGAEQPAAGAAAAPAVPAAVVEETDASSGLFGGIVVGCAVIMGVLGALVLSQMTGTSPAFIEAMAQNVQMVMAAAVGVAIVTAVVGLLIGKAVAGAQGPGARR